MRILLVSLISIMALQSCQTETKKQNFYNAFQMIDSGNFTELKNNLNLFEKDPYREDINNNLICNDTMVKYQDEKNDNFYLRESIFNTAKACEKPRIRNSLDSKFQNFIADRRTLASKTESKKIIDGEENSLYKKRLDCISKMKWAHRAKRFSSNEKPKYIGNFESKTQCDESMVQDKSVVENDAFPILGGNICVNIYRGKPIEAEVYFADVLNESRSERGAMGKHKLRFSSQTRCEDAIKNGISYIADDYGSQKITVAGNGSESVPRFISKCKSEGLKICSDQSEEIADYELAH